MKIIIPDPTVYHKGARTSHIALIHTIIYKNDTTLKLRLIDCSHVRSTSRSIDGINCDERMSPSTVASSQLKLWNGCEDMWLRSFTWHATKGSNDVCIIFKINFP